MYKKLNTLLTSLFTAFSILLFTQNCKEPMDQGLAFIINNKTTDFITWYIPPVQDQLCSIELPKDRPSLTLIAPPNSKFGEFIRNSDYFDNLPSDTFHLFALKYSIYENQPWDSIVTNNEIVEHVKITEDSLKAVDYEIVIDL